MEERHLSLSEATEVLGISERTAYRWIKSGKLRAYKPGRDYRIPESAISDMMKRSEAYPKVQPPLPFEGGEQRREDVYTPWLEFVGRFADRWEAKIAVGAFDRGAMSEFISTLEDILPILNRLGLQEKQEQPPSYVYSYGPIIGEAIDRLIELLTPLLEAQHKQVEESDLAPLRRRREEMVSNYNRVANG